MKRVLLVLLVTIVWVLPPQQPPKPPTHCHGLNGPRPCPEKKHYGDYLGGSKPNWLHGIGTVGS